VVVIDISLAVLRLDLQKIVDLEFPVEGKQWQHPVVIGTVRFLYHNACFGTDPCTEGEVIIQRDAQRPSLCLCLVGQAFGFLAEMCQGVGISVEELVQVADSCDAGLDDFSFDATGGVIEEQGSAGFLFEEWLDIHGAPRWG